jgi:hypothetical protein
MIMADQTAEAHNQHHLLLRGKGGNHHLHSTPKPRDRYNAVVIAVSIFEELTLYLVIVYFTGY